jgi:hypothetical protein
MPDASAWSADAQLPIRTDEQERLVMLVLANAMPYMMHGQFPSCAASV